ncbi:MAG TPA: agmatinase [bacterium]|nr:agmatinase [bacterium]
MSHSAPNNFLGLPDELSGYDKARVVVLPVPYEHTVSYGGGTASGPSAIIEASAQVELYDEELRMEPCDVGVATLPALKVEGLAPQEMRAEVVTAISRIARDGKIPLLLGGEHSVTPAAVEAVAASCGDITVVQIDAHADLREEYEGDPWSHACAMARVREICPAVQVGIRNLSKPEAKLVQRENLPVFFANDMRMGEHWMKEALAAIPTGRIYLTIDLDGLDMSIMPATGTPEPGGMGWYQTLDFIRMLLSERDLVGMDIVELAPIKGMHACDFLAAKLAYKSIGYYIAGLRA